MRLSLFIALLAVAPLARADGPPLGSDAYILSMFPFPEDARGVTRLQPDTPAGPGAKYSPQSLPCPGSSVLPATPGQFTKKYHVDAVVTYDNAKVPGDRDGSPVNASREGIYTANTNVCKLVQNGSGRHPDGSKWCLATKIGRYVLMSDLFYCTNGKDLVFLRGYWEGADLLEVFSSQHPTLTSLNEHVLTTSLGRGDTNHQNPGENFREFVPGPTYAEERKRFLFFTEATPEDILAIDNAIGNYAGPNGTYLQCKDGSFAVRAQGCPK